MPAQQIVIVRHGETEWSQNGRHTGSTDIPLLEEGRRRAAALADRLSEWSFALVLSSPLGRARETCTLAGLGDRAELDDDLREWDYGEYEGITTPQIHERRPDWLLWRDGCPGGESPEQVARRADAVIERLRSADGDAIAFAHGHILRAVAARWIGLDPDGGARFVLKPARISVLGSEHGIAAVTAWNA